MVQVLSDPQFGFLLWNVNARVGMGSTGDDVRLVQYLLVRASGAANAVPGHVSGSSGLTVADVDGVWGPKTDAAQRWFEQNYKGPIAVVADGYIDTVPAGGDIFGNGPFYEYKLSALNELYATAAGGATNVSPTIKNMPNDGQCPPDLAYALQAALNGSDVGDADGADGG